MAKRIIKADEIKKHLEKEGFREVSAKDKRSDWYKKASIKPSCLKHTKFEKSKS